MNFRRHRRTENRQRTVPAALRCLPEQRHQHRNHQHHREQRLHNRYNESNQMKIETNVTAAIERRTRFLHFFRKTKIETVTWKLESVVTLENEKWVMGSDFLKGVELSK